MDLQDFYFSKHDAEHLRQEDDDFHDAICQLCQRTVIRDTLLPLHRKTRRYRKISMEDYNRQALSLEEHRAIFNAIAAGDADLAAQLTTQHVCKAKQNMIERLKHNG
jgi:DNA-binding GntR family transcriptional regulator